MAGLEDGSGEMSDIIINDPQLAYDAMIISYYAHDWWKAASFSKALRKWIRANPGEAQRVNRSFVVNVLHIDEEARRELKRRGYD
jgi:hypothetical protein